MGTSTGEFQSSAPFVFSMRTADVKKLSQYNINMKKSLSWDLLEFLQVHSDIIAITDKLLSFSYIFDNENEAVQIQPLIMLWIFEGMRPTLETLEY